MRIKIHLRDSSRADIIKVPYDVRRKRVSACESAQMRVLSRENEV